MGGFGDGTLVLWFVFFFYFGGSVHAVFVFCVS